MSTDPDEIRADIERTRSALSSDVSTLAETVRPGNVARRQAGRVRGMMGSARETIMGSSAQQAAQQTMSHAQDAAAQAQDAAAQARDAVQAAPETVRRRTEGNPLAAGLIAFGVGWLAGSLLPASGPERRVAGMARDNASAVTEPLRDSAREVAENLREPAQQATQAVRSTAADAARTVRDEGSSAAADVRDQSVDAAQTVRSNAQS